MGDESAEARATPTPDSESIRGAATGRTAAEFSRTTGFVVRQPVAPEAARTVRDRIAERGPSDEAGAAWLLPGDDVVTVSLFLARGDGNEDESDDEDALVWYVEVADDDGWADPVATLARRTPLYDGEFEELLAGEARLYGGSERVVHAANPARPGRPGTADVVLVRVGIEPGVGTWLARFLAMLIDLLEGTRVARKLESSSGEIIEDERMWTETLFLDDADGDCASLWYMEADDMERVVEVYETTDNRVARWSEVVLNFLFERPMAAMGDPAAASDHELLVHETNPSRR